MAEWSIAAVLKTAVRESVPGVRIPPSPPIKDFYNVKNYLTLAIAAVVAMGVFALLWRQGAFLKISAYVEETKEELKKCTWPTWEELRASTAIVIVAIAILGVFTIAIDFVIAWAVRSIV